MAEIHGGEGWVGRRSPGRGRGELPTPGREVMPHPPSVTHTRFSPSLSWQPRAIFLTGKRIA